MRYFYHCTKKTDYLYNMVLLKSVSPTCHMNLMKNKTYFIISLEYFKLLYTNRQSFPFHAFHWRRAYHVRLAKSNCFPRFSARGRQCIIHRWITKKSRAPSHEHATIAQPKTELVLFPIH